jgi:MFS transporter, NNP family, nitrate/nitrite transporter
VTATAGSEATDTARHSLVAGRWIDHWDPEDETFWQHTGRRIANRNLLFSVLSEHIGFSVWTLWSVLVLFMGPDYHIDAAGKFFLVSTPTLVGSVLRLPYTFAVARFGGRNWTIVSAALLLVPTIPRRDRHASGHVYTTFMIVACGSVARRCRPPRSHSSAPCSAR